MALFGKGVHVITVNDYLATRDSEWMGRLYKFLGLTVGLVVHGMDTEAKKPLIMLISPMVLIMSSVLIIYVIIWFSAKRIWCSDRCTTALSMRWIASSSMRRVPPLIISGPSAKSSEMYTVAAGIVPRLKEKVDEDGEGDFTIDLKTRQCALTEEGVAKVEKALGIENLYEPAEY